ncbi:MAG: adenylate/guanylate cyclase domain-containing protein [Planctomycetota bacterium]|jgi:class 3 adenylate cyclase
MSDPADRPAEPPESLPPKSFPPTSLPVEREAMTLGVAFFDLSRMAEWTSSEEDGRVAGFLQRFYELAAKLLEPAGCRIVKFMGDAGLVVFSEENAEQAIFALCDLTGEARRLALGAKLDSYLNVNVHVGPLIAGSFGPKGGKTVNVAARLGRRGVTLSPQAFRRLSSEGRERFRKIKPPITYRLRR